MDSGRAAACRHQGRMRKSVKPLARPPRLSVVARGLDPRVSLRIPRLCHPDRDGTVTRACPSYGGSSAVGRVDPTCGDKSGHDMRTGSTQVQSALERRLKAESAGEVRFDRFTRGRYATDASHYQMMPVGVVSPRSVEDAARAIALARDEGV